MTESHTEHKGDQGKKANTNSFLLGLLVIVVVLLVGVGLYGVSGVKKGSESPFVLGVADVLKTPVATVNGEKVLYTDYVRDKNIVRSFYEDEASTDGTASYTEQEISDQVIARLIANELVAQVAKEYDVTVTKEELDDAMDQLLAEAPDPQTAEQDLLDRFGWTIDEYKQNVLYHIELERQLQLAFQEQGDLSQSSGETEEQVNARHILFQVGPEDDADTVRETAQEVLQQIKDGGDFVALAAQYGSDGTRSRGGDLGWFGKGVMVQEFENVAFALEPGQLSESLVETDFGFHILEVMAKEQRPVEHNLLDFQIFMNDRLENANIEIMYGIHNPFEEIWQAQKEAEVAQNAAIDTAIDVAPAPAEQ